MTDKIAKIYGNVKQAETDGNLVFVYGTLMAGGNNNYLLENADFVGYAQTIEKFLMTATTFPFVSRARKQSVVSGEVYAVDDETKTLLDSLEGHPGWYKRELVGVVLENGREVRAWIYINELNRGRYEIASGDYHDFIKTLSRRGRKCA